MKYVLVQASSESPATDKLQRALQVLPSLTEYDINIMARNAFGILVRNLSAEQANLVAQSLAREGVETEKLPEKELPSLPPIKVVRQIACTREALILHDPYGRPFPLPWQHVWLLAAGNVRVQEFKQVRTERRVSYTDENGMPQDEVQVDWSTREQSNCACMLEVVVTRAGLRYSVTVDKNFLERYLGDRFNGEVASGFSLVVEDLSSYAPGSMLNRGALSLRDEARLLDYPSKNAFYDEMIWMLWKAKA
jgi:hypothetical protein